MEPLNPLTTKQEVRLKVPPSPTAKKSRSISWRLTRGTATRRFRCLATAAPYRAGAVPTCCFATCATSPDSYLLEGSEFFATTAKSLAAAEEVSATQGKSALAELAQKHGVEATR